MHTEISADGATKSVHGDLAYKGSMVHGYSALFLQRTNKKEKGLLLLTGETLQGFLTSFRPSSGPQLSGRRKHHP